MCPRCRSGNIIIGTTQNYVICLDCTYSNQTVA